MTSLASQSNTTAVQTILSNLLDVHQLDPSQIKTDAESLEHWGKDWTKHFAPAASAIVFPKTIEQVQAL
ncbi:FAD-binding oxidoreductase, partial [Psychrobacter sp. APC 3426]|nr:FAD-binding oxidoreductase [Psychrobacter sp. APC 3426]